MRSYQTPVVRKAAGLAAATAGVKVLSNAVTKTG